MTKREDRFTKRRLRSSYFSVVISISLVLFVLGLFGVLIMNTQEISRSVKEDFSLTILLSEDASKAEVNQFFTTLQVAPYTKSARIISKDDAAEELMQILDEDFVDFLGYNPLRDGIELKLKAEELEVERLAALSKEFEVLDFVSEVVYDRLLIEKMNENLKMLGYALLAGAVLLSLIAIALINSSIRLAIYSKRFLIKTMQLVGATRNFIRKPFLMMSLVHGAIGALIALGLLALCLYYLQIYIPGLSEFQAPLGLSLIAIAIFGAGLLISFTCTFFALRKYLKLKTDQLYF
ncbi:cell division protein FtsX [Croceimicrobium hydrocarbonivorans]|uniref:Cell division protein FtsX n=1 Tax=Croceimicrobium hydrocarbonivorans TaxID=2761580 RepID=A0A7H0VAT1_9FLAO|nr:permease-like cell division protein FtsX [Croceimicrobium hydrocarbonivorans]QNR22829.1 cell division protein FtsX [Croceimicrobium hydrocarbonivorans]